MDDYSKRLKNQKNGEWSERIKKTLVTNPIRNVAPREEGITTKSNDQWSKFTMLMDIEDGEERINCNKDKANRSLDSLVVHDNPIAEQSNVDRMENSMIVSRRIEPSVRIIKMLTNEKASTGNRKKMEAGQTSKGGSKENAQMPK